MTARRGLDAEHAVAAALERAEERERIDRSRIELVRGYAESRRCRRQVLLGAFGQMLEGPCGNCDTCADGLASEPADPGGADEAGGPPSGFAVDDRVRHPEWGDGTVMEVEDDRLTVFFQSEGYKVLSLELIEEHGLLAPAPAA